MTTLEERFDALQTFVGELARHVSALTVEVAARVEPEAPKELVAGTRRLMALAANLAEGLGESQDDKL